MKWPAVIERFRKRVQAAEPTMAAVRKATEEARLTPLTLMAAALAYRTLFGLLPVLVVGLLLVRTFTEPDTQKEVIRRALENLGVSAISVQESTIGEPKPMEKALGKKSCDDEPQTASIVPAAGAGGTPNEAMNPEIGPPAPTVTVTRSLQDVVTSVVDSANASINFKAIGIIGIIMLLYSAISMLVEIESAFNQVYRVPRGRGWFRRITTYWSVLTLGIGALVATFYIGDLFRQWMERATQRGSVGEGTAALGILIAGFGVTVFITTCVLVLAYMTVPNTRVKAWPALCGAIVAALAWEMSKWGFTQYLAHSASYAKLYGSIALIPLFMLWMYVTWLIVLFGLSIAYQLQYGLKRTWAVPREENSGGSMVVEPAGAIAVMCGVARTYISGKQVTAVELAKSLSISEGIVRAILGGLSERGLVLRLDRPESPAAEPTYVPGRPLDAIPLADVLKVGFGLASSASGTTNGLEEAKASTNAVNDQAICRMREAQLAAVHGQSVADVVATPTSESVPTRAEQQTKLPKPSGATLQGS